MLTINTSNLQFSGTTPVSIEIENPAIDAVDRLLKLWAACVDTLSPAKSPNAYGKEVVEERWIEARVQGEETWTAIGFPASFPPRFRNLSDCLTFTIDSGETLTLEFRLVPPDGASTSGVVNFEIVGEVVNA